MLYRIVMHHLQTLLEVETRLDPHHMSVFTADPTAAKPVFQEQADWQPTPVPPPSSAL